MFRRLLVLCILVCGLAMALTWAAAAKVQPGEPEGEFLAPQENGAPITLRLNLGADDPVIDPALVNMPPSLFVVNQLFLGLTRVDDESGEILPELASSWEMSADAQVFTFPKRKIHSVKLRDLKWAQADTWCALSEFEVWGQRLGF